MSIVLLMRAKHTVPFLWKGNQMPATKKKTTQKNTQSEVEIDWVRDENFEKILKEEDIKWEIVHEYDISKINWKKSAANMGRPEKKLDDDQVCEIGIAMELGYRMPMCVLAQVRDDVLIVSGNHRAAANRLVSDRTMPVYFIELDSMHIFVELASRANRIEGVANSMTVALDQAEEMVMNGHLTVQDAATKYLVIEGTLRHRVVGAKSLKHMVEEFHLDTAKDLNTIQCEVLGRLSENDTIFREAARLTIDFPRMFTQEKLATLVKTIRQQKTEGTQLDVIMQERRKQLAIVDDLRKKGKDRGKNNRPMSRSGMTDKTKFVRAVHTLAATIEAKTIVDFGFDVDSEECKMFQKECNKVATTLRNIFKK